MSISLYALLILLVAICIWDIKTYEIPHSFILIGIALGFVFAFIDGGTQELFSVLKTLLITFVVTFSIWAIGEMLFGASIIGEGDMKLLIVISLFIGFKTTMFVLYWSIIVGALLFIFMIHPKEISRLFKNISLFFVYAIPKSKVSAKKLAFSIPITIVTAFFIFI